eukprot:SAG11_NODE_13231_length_664_cov_1.375221_1_plen_125_part_00
MIDAEMSWLLCPKPALLATLLLKLGWISLAAGARDARYSAAQIASDSGPSAPHWSGYGPPINDRQLSVLANMLGLGIFALIVIFHYVNAPKSTSVGSDDDTYSDDRDDSDDRSAEDDVVDRLFR